LELLIYYCDTNWNVYWGRSEDLDNFLPLRGLPRQFKSGDKVVIDGPALPVNQEFFWNQTTIQVLSESNALEIVSARGKLLNLTELQSKMVEVEALVDSVERVSPNIFQLMLLAENQPLEGFIHTDQASDTLPDLVGKMVRLRGVYSATLDSFGKTTSLALWVPGVRDVTTIGPLEADPRFSAPLVSAQNFAKAPNHALARVVGTVRSQEPGEAVTIWDDSGQIRILTKQRQSLKMGDHIEAIGYAGNQGYNHILQDGLFCRTVQPSEESLTNEVLLHLAGQVDDLDRDKLARRPRVSLEGEVMCVRSNLVFVEDSSGGIRVRQRVLESGRRIQAGMLVGVEGVAAPGDFAPEITNAVVRQIGTMDLPPAPLVSYEQALTGAEDGRWIQLRGYVRKVTPARGLTELQMVTPGGEFIARVPREDATPSPEGSVVLVRGVCVAVANSRHQLTGIELWSSAPNALQIEQSAPENLFAEPEHFLASLRQFNPFNTLNRRIHTRGVVTLQFPGRLLYLQEGDTSLLALSSQTDPLHPGDRVEIVGFSGNIGGNFLLREAVYRRIAAGPEPKPQDVTTQQSLDDDRDGLLVRLEGLLLETANRPGKTRLIVQANGHATDVLLEGEAALDNVKWLPGSRVAVTGVYRIQRDEYGKPISFFLSLRNADDVRVLAPPPWWTSRRLLFVLAGGLPVFLLTLVLAWQTRRKNQQLERAQVALKTAHDKLEERVQERTRELHEESDARQSALDRLSEAQQRLILASRQAGMAEVATGILHNVGNTLNSVNISTTRIGDFLQRLRIEKFSKAAELITQQGANLPGFFQNDPRGRALPGYLQQLADNMVKTEQTLAAEAQSLAKQIDHVKAVISWQQSHARGSSVAENLNPVELMEDALQINLDAYERHAIQVVRRYENPPQITADRHKVLQILINLLTNAKFALTQSQAKRVVLRIHPEGADRVRFEISDTGAGIPPENLERIFSMGFTTRPNGHGFGLHSGANAAKEMQGCLLASSAGTGKGATFILELPVAPQPAPVVSVRMDRS
jgi:signal transduction histidine kinase